MEKAEEKIDSAKAKLIEKMEKTGLGGHHHSESYGEQRGRPATTNSLEVGSPRGRPTSLRSTRSGEPLVLHGWTLTAPVGFRAVCKTIRESAFSTSNLPIIISLEVHADVEQQEVMVDIMQEEWKGLLIDQAHEACNPDERLPRLEELFNKILIKVKKATGGKLTPSQSTTNLVPVKSRTDGGSPSGSEDERSGQKKKVKICERLSNLGIYTHSEHFVSFEAKSAKTPPHVFSIGESQIDELHETKKEQLIAHNRDFFMRAYPAGFRINSSNLDPSGFWRKGVQMVALNWQNLDMGMMLNEGMFAGENGWVLKPPGYRSDPNEPIQYKSLDLKITVYAGQHIPMPANQADKGFHPYIRCELHVQKPELSSKEEASKDEKESKKKDVVDPTDYKQKTPYRKGDHPDFGQEGHVMQFRTVEKVVEELSFVRYVAILAVSYSRIIKMLPPGQPSGFHLHTTHRHESREPGSASLWPMPNVFGGDPSSNATGRVALMWSPNRCGSPNMTDDRFRDPGCLPEITGGRLNFKTFLQFPPSLLHFTKITFSLFLCTFPPTKPPLVSHLTLANVDSFDRFKVEDAGYTKDSVCAWACIRLDRLQQGYRFVHLHDMKGQATQGLLFVKVEKKLKPVENVKIFPVGK